MSNLKCDMSELYHYGLSFQTWLLVGIITYVFMILFLIYVKYCVSRRVFCPCCNCHLHCAHFGLCCRHASVCAKCGADVYGGPFCCSRTHSITGGPLLPEVKCKCFAPSCSYMHCFCCEVSLQNKIEQADIV